MIERGNADDTATDETGSGSSGEAGDGEAAPPPALPKFRPEGLMLAFAGGGAGLFSALIGGWVNGNLGSHPVTRTVRY